MLGQLIEHSNQLTIVDMEASVEHMSRGTVRHTDAMLIVTEPYYRSLETAGRIAELARGLGIPQIYVVANKVRSPLDEEAIQRYCTERGLEIVAVLPFDEEVLQADQLGTPVLDRHPEASYVVTVKQLRERLLSEPNKATATE